MTTSADRIITAVEDALGETKDYFEITTGEILVGEEDNDFNFSMTVCFKPKCASDGCSHVNNVQHFIQFDINDNDDVVLIHREDTELDISYGNIYCQLYWSKTTSTD